MHAFRRAVWLALLLPAVALADDRPPPPDADCLDARAVVEARHLDAQALLVDTGASRYAVTLAGQCPPAPDVDVALLSPHGWVCGGRPEVEFLRVENRLCAIGQVAPMSAKAFAATLRKAHVQSARGAIPRLQGLEVRAKAPDRSRFLRSTDYCFDPRWVRSWSSDARGIVVDTSPRRSGGNRYYRVELDRSCPELEMAQAVSFHSGVGGAVCGNVGDHARPIRGTPDGFASGGILTSSFTRGGCPITAVYPVRSPSDS